MSAVLKPQARPEYGVHIPLTDAGLCLSCDAVFNNTDASGCPACGARTVFLIATWIKPMKHEISLAAGSVG